MGPTKKPGVLAAFDRQVLNHACHGFVVVGGNGDGAALAARCSLLWARPLLHVTFNLFTSLTSEERNPLTVRKTFHFRVRRVGSPLPRLDVAVSPPSHLSMIRASRLCPRNRVQRKAKILPLSQRAHGPAHNAKHSNFSGALAPLSNCATVRSLENIHHTSPPWRGKALPLIFQPRA